MRKDILKEADESQKNKPFKRNQVLENRFNFEVDGSALGIYLRVINGEETTKATG